MAVLQPPSWTPADDDRNDRDELDARLLLVAENWCAIMVVTARAGTWLHRILSRASRRDTPEWPQSIVRPMAQIVPARSLAWAAQAADIRSMSSGSGDGRCAMHCTYARACSRFGWTGSFGRLCLGSMFPAAMWPSTQRRCGGDPARQEILSHRRAWTGRRSVG